MGGEWHRGWGGRLALGRTGQQRGAHVPGQHARAHPPLRPNASAGLNMSGPAYKYTSANAFSYDVGAEDDDGVR